MGCDIHMFAEKKQADGTWSLLTDFHEGEDSRWFKDSPYYERNYALFSILADVRNCCGEYEFACIDKPRGLPEDTALWDDEGGHSRSWFMLKELLDFDWNKKIKRAGVVSELEYKVFLEQGHPNSWAGGVGGTSAQRVTPEVMDKILSGEIPRDPGVQYYVEVDWTETYEDCCGTFVNETLPTLSARGNPDEIRVVFWFDS